MTKDFDTNKQPGFHILICMIEIWKPKDPKKPNGDIDGPIMRICEVEEVEIEESYKKLIGTASVRFPRGTVVRKTLTTWNKKDADDFKSINVNISDSGVVEETRTYSTVANADTFSVGQRIRIYLGYTTDPKVAEMAKTGNTGKTIYNDQVTCDKYLEEFHYINVNGRKVGSAKKYMSLMFDGYITKISIDTPIELECENLASFLKTVTCPKVTLKKCTVKDMLGEDGGYNLLKDTGLKLHSDTAKMTFDLGAVELSTDLTVADVLTEWAKFGLFCYVGDDNGDPAIQIGRAYFSNPDKDSILNATTTPQYPVDIHFDYHVAENGLSLTSSDKEFLAVEAQGLDDDDKFIHITVIKNPEYDSSKPDSADNAAYRYVNETKLSKQALKAGKRYVTDSPDDKVDTKLYTKIAFMSKTIPITHEKLAEEAVKYLEGYNVNGIEGTLTLFGDFRLRTAQQVRLIDNRYPNKNGLYIVDEVHTTFGVNGFRQKIKLPYCIKRDGDE